MNHLHEYKCNYNNVYTQLLMKKKPNGNGSVNGLILVRSGLNAMVVYFLME